MKKKKNHHFGKDKVQPPQNEEEFSEFFASDEYHIPVMLKECCDFLVTDPNGIYTDGTLGGGGHTAEILRRLGENGKLNSFDSDHNAIEYCQRRFAEELAKGSSSKLVLHHRNFFGACSIEEGTQLFPLTGLLLDLGVSSHQLDSDSIGLSYRVNSRLDMRFGSHGRSADDLLTTEDEDEIARVLRFYGEEPHARKIARRIVQSRPIHSTFELRAIIEEITPPQLRFKTLSRVFQAIRIAVNDELTILEQTLHGIIPQLAKGGRIVVLTYHSLEDRIVKTIFKEESLESVSDPTMPKGYRELSPTLKLITPKPLSPSEAEIAMNPRSRSAKLRIAEKI